MTASTHDEHRRNALPGGSSRHDNWVASGPAPDPSLQFDPDPVGIAHGDVPPAEVGRLDSPTTSVEVGRWPQPPAPTAYYGLAGRGVALIEPHSEADPAALLAQFLVVFGNVIGRGPHFVAEADRHFTNLFLAIVGETAKGRKGASWGHVRRLFTEVDAEWAGHRILGGLSSGEGIVWHLRDLDSEQGAKDAVGSPAESTAPRQTGTRDKRLLAFESELASVLRVVEREGNTLSAVVRNAWDTGNLQTLTKNAPARSSGGHVSVVGHISAEELRRYMGRTELANGFANRFLWIAARRSKLLPEGGSLRPGDLSSFVRELNEAVTFARSMGVRELRRDDEARDRWREVYPDLSEGRAGLLGAVTSRAEAQVMRLALLYALLDRSEVIGRVHLEAALSLWDYADRSAAYLWGNRMGDADADRVVEVLTAHPAGLPRSEISGRAFSRNASQQRIDRARDVLTAYGRLVVSPVHGRGRPSELWRLR